MPKINEKLSIEIWKIIAYQIQKLRFSNCGEEEFAYNLQTLKELLTNLDLELVDGVRNPIIEKEIGLSSLLQSIYDSQMLTFCKSGFYEKIYTLEELGVQEIKYCPLSFPDTIKGKKVYYNRQDKTIIQKIYTDGSFELQSEIKVRKNDNGTYYEIRELSNADFLLDVTLEKYKERVKLKRASAYLKKFRADLPSKMEILSANFPEIQLDKQIIAWDATPKIKEVFNPFAIKEELDLKKRLVLDYGNGWYYKENEKN